jgi:putative DNA primase/helicase
LRINELKNGLIQFTDSTNAMRLVKEHGRDIRYNAAWKKWVVWNGKYWEMDEGDVLIHEKGKEKVSSLNFVTCYLLFAPSPFINTFLKQIR